MAKCVLEFMRIDYWNDLRSWEGIYGLVNINFYVGQIYLGIYLSLESVLLQAVKVNRIGFWDVKVKNWTNWFIILFWVLGSWLDLFLI